MNNTINVIIEAAGWLLFVLTLVASYFEYAKKHDPQVADKMKHVGTFAEWAVSLQDTLDKPNPDKLASATNDLLKQAEKTGIKLTPEMAQGAVEKVVADRKKAKPIQTADDKPVLKELPNNKTEQQPQPTSPDTIGEVHNLLDDLEVK